MNEPFDTDLHERLDRLSSAVPVETDVGSRPVAQRPASTRPVWRSPINVAIPLAALVILVLVGLDLADHWRQSSPPASEPGTGVTSFAPSNPPVSASTTDGPFELTVRADHASYSPNDPIAIEASLTYAGPEPTIDIHHGHGSPLGFGIVEPVLGIELAPGWRLSCEGSTLKQGVALTKPFTRVLRLPEGTWHVYAVAWFEIGDCDGERHELRVDITIEVATPLAPSDAAGAFPGVCASLGLTANRCAGFAAWAVEQAGLEHGHVQRIDMTRVDCPGQPACPTDGTGFLITVDMVTDSGDPLKATGDCTVRPGVFGAIDLVCDEITTSDGTPFGYPMLFTPVSGGYRDVPCSGEAPVGCATPLPTIEPSALAASAPLTIGTYEIAIDHAGTYSVVLGQAVLPNGILTISSAEITSPPTNPLVSWDGYRLQITSLNGGEPFSNYYGHGRRPGIERVEVTLEFEVLVFEPGAKVVLSGVEIR